MESRRLCGEFLDKLASGVDIDAAKLKAGARIEPGAFTVNELCLAFMRHAATYYVKNEQPTDEIDCLKSAVRPLVARLNWRHASGSPRPNAHAR